MKISELKNAPQWLLDADTYDEDVDIIDGDVVWRDGVWRDGEWRAGVWHGGEWRDGVWRAGVWRDGVWCSGVWCSGVWCGGVWRDGVWRGGAWFGGTWCSGALYKHSPYYTYAIHDTIAIGCQRKTRAEWDNIFSNAQEFEYIERGTELARATYAEYKAMCAYKDAWDSDVWK